jgi:CheY-like chemotaxis protein
MSTPLHILVVDDRPDSVLFLTEFLLSRHLRVETCGNGTEALEAVLRRHRTSDAYDLVISDVTMPGMDGLALLRELRRRQILVPLALYTAYGSLNPTLQQQATQLGCLTVLDKPLELRRIERLVEEVSSRRSGTRGLSRAERDEQPFFGTSRVARTATPTVSSGPGVDSGQPVTGALERKPGSAPAPGTQPPAVPPAQYSTTSFTRRTVDPQRPPAADSPPAQYPTTSFARRSLDPQPLPASDDPPAQYPTTSFTRRTVEPPTKPPVTASGYVRRPSGLFLSQGGNVKGPTTTARIRRSISGTHVPPTGAPPVPPPVPPPGNSPSRAVSCAHCRRIFLVLSKPDIFNAVCVHCGGLNRIDPL